MFALLKKDSAIPGHCSIQQTSNRLIFSHVVVEANQKPIVRVCEEIPFTDRTQIPEQLTALVKKHELEGANCTWILPPQDYRLLLIEKPNVADKEMDSATRWLVKDWVSYPLEDTAVQTFNTPLVSNKKMIYACVSQISLLKHTAETIESCGLHVHSITIPELSLLGLFTLQSMQNSSDTFLYCDSDNIQLFIFEKKEFCISRKIQVSISKLADETKLEPAIAELSTDIQRSFDYLERQYQEKTPHSLFVLPYFTHDIITPLNTALGIEVKTFDIKSLVEFKSPELQEHASQSVVSICAGLAAKSSSKQFINFLNTLPKKDKHYFSGEYLLIYIAGIVLLLTAYFALIAAGWSITNHKLSNLQSQLSELQVQQNTLLADPEVIKNQALESKVDAVNKKIKEKTHLADVLSNNQTTNSQGFYPYLVALQETTAPDTWLTEIQFTDGGSKIYLTGKSVSSVTITHFLRNLRMNAAFNNIEFTIKSITQPKEKESLMFVIEGEKS